MADFISVIQRAVDGLPNNTPQMRTRVYDKARGAIRRQLENMASKPSEQIIQLQLDKLEKAIQDVDAQYIEKTLEPENETPPKVEITEQLSDPTPPPFATNEIANTADSDADAEVTSNETEEPVAEPYAAHDRQPQPEMTETASFESFKQGEQSNDPADEIEVDDNGKISSVAPSFEASPEIDSGINKIKSAPDKQQKSPAIIILLVTVAILLGAAGYGVWKNSDDLGQVFSTVSEQFTSLFDAKTPLPSDEQKGDEPAKIENSTNSEKAPEPEVLENIEKFTQRLQTDGSEIDNGKAPDTSLGANVEGTSIAEQANEDSKKPTTFASNEEAPKPEALEEIKTEEKPAQPGTVNNLNETKVEEAPKPTLKIGQKLILYERAKAGAEPTSLSGSIIWSLGDEAANAGDKPEKVIRGKMKIPENGMIVDLTIKPNRDRSLPASHTIEIIFLLPENFKSGAVDKVESIYLKQTEQERGEQLLTAIGKITPEFYLIGLNDFSEAQKFNTDLLKSRPWLDILFSYTSGHLGLLSLEKGSTGADVFAQAFVAWK